MECDDLVIGSGMAGLAVASLLARSGRRTIVLEAHDVPGGYAHTFAMKEFRFCAQVHYIFGCGEGETVDRLLERLQLRDVPRTSSDADTSHATPNASGTSTRAGPSRCTSP